MTRKLTYEELEQRIRELERKAFKRNRAEDALGEVFEFKEKIISESPIGISVYDASGQCVAANDSIGRIIGATREQVLEQNYNNIESWKECGLLNKAKSAIRENSTKRHELKVKSTFGKNVSLDCHLVPFSSEGKTHLLLMTNDISERMQVQEALRFELFSRILLLSPIPTTITTISDGRLVKANEAFWRLTGYGHDMLGQSTTKLDMWVDPEERTMVGNILRKKGSVHNMEIQVRTASGGIRYCLYSAEIIEFGDEPHVLSMAVDITERKHAEETLAESKEKYSILVKNALTGIYIDQDGKIVFANDRFGEIYGYPREEFIGIESWKLVHPDDRPLTNQIRARRLKGEDAPSEYEARGLTKNGETIWIRRRNTRIEYGGKPAILGNIVDVTEEKRAEEELRKINEELKNFVHIVSHDLKTPAISIQGFSSRLLKNYQEKLGKRGRKYVEQIEASGRRMEALVSDLLELSQIGWVVSTFEDIPSLEILRNVTSGLQDRLKEDGIELVVADNLPAIYCDGKRIYQVFENLLVNAIKFTRSTNDPKIEVGCEDIGNFHRFHVRDNGIGIDPKHHRKIFELFHRLKLMEDEEGTGLGLAIVERIITNHGGKVWVESEKGKGATFYFTLPKAPHSVRDP